LQLDASSTARAWTGCFLGPRFDAPAFFGWLSYFLLFFSVQPPRPSHGGLRGGQGHTSTYLKVVALVEAALLIGLAIPLWAHAVEQFPKGSKPGDVTTIKVIAAQFNWHAGIRAPTACLRSRT